MNAANKAAAKLSLSRESNLTSSLYLRDNVEFHIAAGAVIQGSSNPEDYADFRAAGFIHQKSAENSAKFLIGAVSAKKRCNHRSRRSKWCRTGIL